MKLYTCAFAFDQNWVLLIRKAKPDWQRGLLNGIGGKVEPGETITEATVREFHEETGVDPTLVAPIFFHSMLWPEYLSHTDWPLVYFSAFALPYQAMQEAVSNTLGCEEPCVIMRLDKPFAKTEMMANLPFLIEMARCMVMCSPEERKLRQPIIFSQHLYQRIIEEFSIEEVE